MSELDDPDLRQGAIIACILEAIDFAGAERDEAIQGLLGALEIQSDSAGRGPVHVFAKALLSAAGGDPFIAREAVDEAHISATAGEVILEAQQEAATPRADWSVS